jgi:hypothetical protein
MRNPGVSLAPAHLDLALLLPHVHHSLQGLDPLVVLELLSEVIVDRGVAQHLDDDDRVCDGLAAVRIRNRRATHGRDVRIGGQAGGEHPDPQIGAEHAAGPTSQRAQQPRGDGDRERRVERRASAMA